MPRFAVTVKPDWDELQGLHSAVAGFLATASLERDVVDAVVMVATELGENAVKYGSYSDGSQIEVEITCSADSVMVEVRHPVAAADTENLARLDRMIQWIRGYQDPFQAYVERLREVSIQSLDDEESGLGLARVAYEGQSIIDFFVNERDILAVSAVHQLT